MHQQEVNWLAVSWAPYSRRSEMFARELNGRLRCIHYLRFQYPLHAPLKYILQAARTWQVLWRERPDAVHVQTPPFLCGLVAYLYGRLSGLRSRLGLGEAYPKLPGPSCRRQYRHQSALGRRGERLGSRSAGYVRSLPGTAAG